MNEFYKHLREARKANSLTQEELAEKADISRVMVSRYETGAVIPTLEVLVSLADALGVSTDYLLGRSEHESAANSPSSNQLKHNILSAQDDLPKNKEELRHFIIEVLKDCFDC